MDELLGEHERREVVPALAPVLLGLVQTEEAELAHPGEDPVGERRLLPLLRVRRQLGDDEAMDGLPQLLVLIGEDEVPTAGAEIRLEDGRRGRRVDGRGDGGAHGATLAESDAYYLPRSRPGRLPPMTPGWRRGEG